MLPIVLGYMPVIIDDRVGAHTGYGTKAFVYRQPSAASRSRFGVSA
jgi:hypothetical protein